MADLSLARAAADPAVAPRTALIAGGAVHTFADLAARAAPLRAALAGRASARDRAWPSPPGTASRPSSSSTRSSIWAPPSSPSTRASRPPRSPSSSPTRPPPSPCATATSPRPPPAPAPAPSLLPDTLPLALLYTSGTTGRPKGALLSRGAFAAAAAASAQNLGWQDDDRWLLAMPVCHVGGLSILTRCLLARRPVVLEPRFDPDAVLAAVVRERATLLSVVPTMLNALLERDADGALARLRAVLVGVAGTPFSLLEGCEARGIPAITTYGLTEACSQVTVQRPSLPLPRAARGSGEPLPGVHLSIRRADGTVAEPGEVGRIHVGGPTLIDGYFRGPGRPLDRARGDDGLFDTGDLGEIDAAGALHVHARRTDLIVTGGENVYPVEVEQRLEALPGVRRALVFGVPDERWGQIVAAALELDRRRGARRARGPPWPRPSRRTSGRGSPARSRPYRSPPPASWSAPGRSGVTKPRLRPFGSRR